METRIDKEALEKQKADLKIELKTWEGQFAKDNGRKAGREDIKAHAAIALKYKEYTRIHDLLYGKTVPKPSSAWKQKRPLQEQDAPESPSKRLKTPPQATPQKSSRFLAPTNTQDITIGQDADEYIRTPAARRTFIGPTPQRNGVALGIFDSPPLPLKLAGTPSRTTRNILAELDPNSNGVAVTPSNPVGKIQESPVQYEERARGSRTPASTGKRFMLDSFLTPSHKRVCLDESVREPATPSSAIKTPAFLRRDNFVMNIGTIQEQTSPQMVRQPWMKRSFGRSLSGMIKDLRKEQEKEQEKTADDDLDLLREMEDEEMGIASALKKAQALAPPKLIVQDSQGGLDRDGFVPSDVEAEKTEEEKEVRLGRDGKPLKPWKKKGLKRQTRRVNMRPVAKKAQPASAEAQEVEEEDLVPETQAFDDAVSELEHEGSEDEYSDVSTSKAKSETKAKTTKAPAKKDSATAEKTTNKRKVKPEAHANYRALKIKNKNSKGNGGGRFGRRR